MKISDRVRVVDSKINYTDNGTEGVIVGEDSHTWVVEFTGGTAMDYFPDEIEVLE